MNVLVTGGAGFIGSNFIKYVLAIEPEVRVINIDALTYAGSLDNLRSIESDSRYNFVQSDIRDESACLQIILDNRIDIVINFAAESHVDRSINNPSIFIETNVVGCHNLLLAAKKVWQTGTDSQGYPTYREGVRFLQVSTDEVYGSLGKEGLFTEDTPVNPNSPYSASKASADMLVNAFHRTYAFPCNITRCSNNYGQNQYPEKLIPLMIYKTLNHKPLPVYGDGQQIRDWLYVEDHCSAIWTVIKKAKVGEIYNIGGNNEKANIDIVKLILKELEGDESLIDYVKDRLGHDRRYAIDNTKITRDLGWAPAYTFEEGIKKTIQWYKENQKFS